MKKLSISLLAFAMMGGFALVGCADAEDPGDIEPTEEAAEEVDTPPEMDLEDE